MTGVTASLTALLCALAALALTRRMRILADSDSRWLRSGCHVLLAAAGGVGAALLSDGLAELATYGLLAVAFALLVTIDLAAYRLPDLFVLPLYPLVFVGLMAAAAMSGDWSALGRAVLAGAALLAFYFLLALINPSGLGLGDVKLSGVMGMFLGWLGWPAVLAGTLAAFILNAVVAVTLLAARRVDAKSGIPFGPAMVVGAAAGAAYWTWRASAGA